MVCRNNQFFCLSILVSVFCFAASSCNKNINSESNKAFVCFTNVSPDASPIRIVFDLTDTLTGSGAIPFGSTSGVAGNPYLTAVAGIHNLQVLGSGGQKYVDGNIALSVSHYYSFFAYDSVTSGGSLRTLILQDVLNPVADTSSSVRFLNFSSNAPFLYVQFTDARDTFYLGNRYFPFVGDRQTPSALSSNSIIKAGTYHVVGTMNSTSFYDFGSMTFTGSKIYTLYTKFPVDSTTTNSLGVIHHN
ncbi:MAG: hypothetical protein C5B59_12980 [Bacteroidetes bacterium]|nr:MAG: hypothetical protein C5B59_12980 [Bacteroidota bacterium]